MRAAVNSACQIITLKQFASVPGAGRGAVRHFLGIEYCRLVRPNGVLPAPLPMHGRTSLLSGVVLILAFLASIPLRPQGGGRYFSPRLRLLAATSFQKNPCLCLSPCGFAQG